jgi:hypothetical protein
MAGAVTFVFTIPANSDYWRMEIWKRGGGAWTFDKNGRLSWMWTVKPISGAARTKKVIAPAPRTNFPSERL